MIPHTNTMIYVCNGVGKDPVVKHNSFNCPGGETKVPLPTTVTGERSRKLSERCRLKQVHPWLTSTFHFLFVQGSRAFCFLLELKWCFLPAIIELPLFFLLLLDSNEGTKRGPGKCQPPYLTVYNGGRHQWGRQGNHVGFIGGFV